MEHIATSSERSKGMYSLRLVALAGTTFFGIYLSASIFVLGTAFNHTARHFPMFITTQDLAKTFLAGVGFLASAIAYVALVKKTERTSPRSR
jgi:hypothetical protein